MIQEVYYKKNKMHIKDDDGKEIISNEISFTRAFQFAQLNDVIFHYTNLTTADAVQFSRYLQKEIGSCDNRNIYDFFLSINENIHLIINDIDLFSIESAKKTIQNIIEDHNDDVVLYNIEAYGTDPYIAQTVYEELKIAQRQNNTVEIKILLSIIDTDEYDLDTFIEAVKKLAPISKQFKGLMSCKSAWVEFETHRVDFHLGISDDWQYAYNIITPLKIYNIIDDSQYEVLKEKIDDFFKYDGFNWNREEEYQYDKLDYFLSTLHPLLDKCLHY